MMEFRVGQQESASKVITSEDVKHFDSLVQAVDPALAKGANTRLAAHDMLAGNLIGALLDARLPGPGSTLLSQQLEYLAPILLGDTLTARVEVITWLPEKRLITLKTDCFNQAGRQILTGQVVLAVTM